MLVQNSKSLCAKLKCPLLKGAKMDKILTMSTKELSLLEVMQCLEERRLIQKEAAVTLGLNIRQVKRL